MKLQKPYCSLMATGLLLIAAFGATGCATKKYVDQQVTGLDTRANDSIAQVRALAMQNQADIQSLTGRVSAVEQTQQTLNGQVAELHRSMHTLEAASSQPQSLHNRVVMQQDVLFEFGRFRLTENARARLDSLAAQLQDTAFTAIHISGHTDHIGGEVFNSDLGRRRAETVSAYLAQQGVERHRIHVITLGEAVPVGSSSTADDQARSRRVEVRVVQFHSTGGVM